MKKNLIILVIAIYCVTACGTSSTPPTQDIGAIQTSAINTAWAAANLTSTANVPTNTPQPTNTPLPTNTPVPTLTPTPLPQPQNFQGEGDMVVDLPSDSIGVLHIVGNSASRYFGVKGFDANNNELDSLVNTTDIYDGRVPLNFYDDGIARLQVTGQGGWNITYYPISSYDHFIASSLTISGNGDDVWLCTGIMPDKLKIFGNQASRYFGVKVIGDSNRYDSAVNTTDPYSGEYLYPANLGELLAIVVTAQDQWEITIVPK